MSSLFLQALLAFLLLPGLVAFVVPLVLIEPVARTTSFHMESLIPLVIGTALLLACVREFYVAGKGTLAPWTPPVHLVTTGLYRFSRNPMYVAVPLILLGWTLAYRSRSLAMYTIAIVIAFYLRVVFYEEPWLARTHGPEWERYKARVPRWLGPRRSE